MAGPNDSQVILGCEAQPCDEVCNAYGRVCDFSGLATYDYTNEIQVRWQALLLGLASRLIPLRFLGFERDELHD